MFILIALGITAGFITTLSGFGGGAFMVACLAILWDPLTALTVSAMALFVGNIHRLYLFQAFLQRSYSIPAILGAIPGALLGSLLATALPAIILQIAILVATLVAIVKMILPSRFLVSLRLLAPSTCLVAFFSATTGGGGFLMAPLLLSMGIRGNAYIATASSTAIAIHLFRMAGYSTAGLMSLSLFGQSIWLALSIMSGNLLAKKIRLGLNIRQMQWIELAAPIICALVAAAGLFL